MAPVPVTRHVGALRAGGLVTARPAEPKFTSGSSNRSRRNLMGAVCEWVHPETREHFNDRLSELQEWWAMKRREFIRVGSYGAAGAAVPAD